MNGIGKLKNMKYVRGFKICHPSRVALLVASAVLGPSVAGHTLEEEDARVWITHLLLLLMLQTIQNTREARTVCYNNKNCYI